MKDNGIVDVLWGIIHIVPNLLVITVQQRWNFRQFLVLGLVSVWGLRLAYYIAKRHNGKEDFRYAEMRKGWERHGKCSYYSQAFLWVFFMQAVFSLISGGAALMVSIWSETDFYFLDAVGAAVWLLGFVIEIFADRQMATFRATPALKGTLIQTGLWRYSRHPNYFGEALLWWGIYLIACSVHLGWVTIFAPLWITILVRFISGVPLLEKKYKDREDWKIYCRETNVFVPWFVRKVDKSAY
jgi:steroid 5-alpha reductase family enzyme